MSLIVGVHARKILDARGNPAVEAEVALASGACGRAAVPSADRNTSGVSRCRDIGALQAVTNVETIIAPMLIGMDALDQASVDRTMLDLDATDNKSNLGANAILSVSLAVARAAADYLKIPLYRYIGGVNARQMPTPMMSILNGGRHAGNNVGFQDLMIVPGGAASWNEALRMCAEVFHNLRAVLKNKGHGAPLRGEGGFAPVLLSNEDALDCVVQAIKRAGYRPGGEVAIALGVGAGEFYDADADIYQPSGEGRVFTATKLIDYYEELIRRYPVISIEDGLAGDDWQGWQEMTDRLGHIVQLVGGDLFGTNTQRLRQGIRSRAANAILIKPEQAGSLTETLHCIETARRAGWAAVISQRCGEADDEAFADIAVGVNSWQIKTGAPSLSDGEPENNRLLGIEEELNSAAHYDGWEAFGDFSADTDNTIY
ncbi:MAG: phosphopyruvate hydratase [Firmicutes bacterium]|nr:phosphopyruvate hydratase [Bacillota bacterium]